MASTMTHELPPILKGSEQQQLASLRDYLVRLAQTLNAVESAPVVVSTPKGISGSIGKQSSGTAQTIEELKKQASDLKSLIIKTADTINVRMDETVRNLESVYVAQSDFGEYQETVNTTIRETAKDTIESYDYGSQINTLNDGLNSLQEYLTLINGEIRRGIILDPSTGQDVLGIAISQSLTFTAETTTEGGLVYHRIAANQTFGLYTSTGWQFWINGQKVGWFDSMAESALHVASIITETSIRFGQNWIIDQSTNSIGFRYLGS